MNTQIDFDEFDESHPAMQAEIGRIKRLSDCTTFNHKYWIDPGFVGLGELTVIYAQPESGKSFFAVDLACRCASGVNWDGSKMWQPQSVLYIATERGDQVERRAHAYCQFHHIDLPENLQIRRALLDLTDPDGLMVIVRTAQYLAEKSGLDLVIIDTLANGIRGSDSNPEVMAQAVRTIMRALSHGDAGGDTGPSFVVLHHTPKDSPKQLRGGSQLLGAADTTILLSKKPGIFTAEVVKANDTPEKPKRHFKIETVSFGKNDDGIETTAGVVVPCEPPKAANSNRSDAMPANAVAAIATLKGAIKACDGPVTDAQWRAASYAEAGDMKPASKRVRYNRSKTAAKDYIIEDNGLFRINEGVTQA